MWNQAVSFFKRTKILGTACEFGLSFGPEPVHVPFGIEHKNKTYPGAAIQAISSGDPQVTDQNSSMRQCAHNTVQFLYVMIGWMNHRCFGICTWSDKTLRYQDVLDDSTNG